MTTHAQLAFSQPLGRPMGHARSALISALRSGAQGTFDVLARHAGICPAQARIVLHKLRRDGLVAVQGRASVAGAGRPRSVYGVNRPFDSLGFALINTLRYI